jgi:putative hydrolase of the HAD superfamily
MIRAIVFDLDDTLYPQSQFLEGAWRHVARVARRYDAPEEMFRVALVRTAARGSDQGRIINDALVALDLQHVPSEPLVDAFRRYSPAKLMPFRGVPQMLARVRSKVPIALLTDGEALGQRAKLRALRLEHAFDAAIFSDELGRGHRKPHPAPFRQALSTLGVAAEEAVMIGDRPDKDVAGATVVGMRAIRVRTGEYAYLADDPPPWRSAFDVVGAVEALESWLPPVSRGR